MARGFRLAGVRFALEFDAQVQADHVLPVFAHLPEVSLEDAETRLRVVRTGRAYEVRADEAPVASCWTLGALAPTVNELLSQIAIRRQSVFLQIHAGAIESSGAAILFPGPRGNGKTTLTAACIARGFGYLTDEVALLDEDALRVRPMPLGLTVKRGAVELLAPDFPELEELPEHVRQDGQRVRYLPPPQARDDGTSLPVSHVVFPRCAQSGRSELRVLPRVEALRRMLDACRSLPAGLSRTDASSLITWIRGADCYELRMADLEGAVSLVRLLTP